MIEFVVLGRPQPAGSKTGIPIYRKGKQFTGKVAMVDAARNSRPWKTSVTAAAAEALKGQPPLEGPLQLEVTFYTARPASHFGSGRNAHLVRASAPRHPAVRPDATKLLRAVEDAMTDAGVWKDDAQIVTQVVRKRFGRPERAEIKVAPAAEPSLPPDRER